MNENQNATFVQGDTQYFDVSVVDGSGDAVDLTGATIEYTLTHKETPLTKTRDDGITVTDAANGEFEILLSSSDTAELRAPASHHVEITDSDGDVATVLTGVVFIDE